MKQSELALLVGRRITLRDSRTGVDYPATIVDAKLTYGNLRVTCDGLTWFQATDKELEIRK